MSDEWIETSTGNRISKSALISGTNNITINDNSTINEKVVLQGDVELLSQQQSSPAESKSKNIIIKLGKFCYLGPKCQIIPPLLKKSTSSSPNLHGPIRIGSYCIIGANSTIRSASIGARVIIEDDCLLDDLSIVYDCCVIKRGTVIPSKMIIPPFSEVSGVPGVNFDITELNSSYKKLIELEARNLHLLG